MKLATQAFSLKQDFNRLAEEVLPLLYVARSGNLQRRAIIDADELIERIEQVRIAAIIAQDAAVANTVLALTCLGQALASELRMYVLLKSDEPEKAWEMLVSAQQKVDAAMRADRSLTALGAKATQLRLLEERLFPPQTFTSIGLLAKTQRCSICRRDYDDCDHVAGHAYVGRFCSIVPEGIATDHVAIVEHPADRRCRLTSQGVPGKGMRNMIFWEIAPSEDGSDTPENAMHDRGDEIAAHGRTNAQAESGRPNHQLESRASLLISDILDRSAGLGEFDARRLTNMI